MQRHSSLLLVGTIVGIICCYTSWKSLRNYTSEATTATEKMELVTQSKDKRESITFILGVDKEDDNRYYEEATRYYAHHPQGKTDYLVIDCRSLLEVRDYLEREKPCNELPWGLINLVSHGNQWTGLSVKVTPDSKRATPARIEEYIQNKIFRPLPNNIVDTKTELFIHGCGIGNNHQLLNTVALAFGGSTEYKPVVRASCLFEYYASLAVNNTVVRTERYMAKNWFVVYKMGEKPSTIQLINELREKYPDVPVDWRLSLLRSTPERAGQPYHYTFEVPVKWIIPVSYDSLPDLTLPENQLIWMQNQKQVTDELTSLQLPFEKFSWSFQQVYVNEGNVKRPAIWVKGYCTILCVLQALTDETDNSAALQKPLVASLNDAQYYCSTGRSLN